MDAETTKTSRWQRFKARSKDNYRLVVMNAETFDEVGAYNLTPLNLYVAASSLILLLTILVFLLIAYTPLRKYVPGYGDVVQRQEVMALEEELKSLQKSLTAQMAYTENFRRILAGEVTTGEEVESNFEPVEEVALEDVTLSEEEVRLRREVELERIGQLARNTKDRPAEGANSGLALEQIFLVAPINGDVMKPYDPTQSHLGVDIQAAKNTAVKATAAGVVFMSEFTSANGNVVGIQHDNDLISFYKHNSELLKKVGDRVNSGEAIAISGNTGSLSTGPHLHFELWYRGKTVDPVDYLSF